ncbi:hypothetical protein C7M84_003116 [Penaeus vannamei]|uniref:Uncharacterized protein n=1 Tax=Penaeus vannamei TaxID=6689 RepID=A0A3R7MBE5_PENVA|nr:hypothetical protein C7M84_003116 [Penaeus vannamei]
MYERIGMRGPNPLLEKRSSFMDSTRKTSLKQATEASPPLSTPRAGDPGSGRHPAGASSGSPEQPQAPRRRGRLARRLNTGRTQRSHGDPTSARVHFLVHQLVDWRAGSVDERRRCHTVTGYRQRWISDCSCSKFRWQIGAMTEKESAILDRTDTPEMEGSTAQTVLAPEETGGAALPMPNTPTMEGDTAKTVCVPEEEGSAPLSMPDTPAMEVNAAQTVTEEEGSAALSMPDIPGMEENAAQTVLVPAMMGAALPMPDTTAMEGNAAETVPIPGEEGRANHLASVALERVLSSGSEEGNVALSKENAALPKENAALSKENAALSKENAALPKENAALSKENAALPKENTALTKKRSSTSSTDTPEMTISSPSPMVPSSVYDGGWGWCIVVSGFLTLFVLSGISLSLATLLGAHLTALKAPDALGTWIFNVQSAVWCFAGLWAEPLSLKYTHRLVGSLAAILCSIAIMISASVRNPYLFFITISIMFGTGGGISVTCCFQMNRRYFCNRVGMANGLVLCGGTLGVAMMSTLAGTLQYQFNFVYSTLIMGTLPLIPAITSFITFIPRTPHWESEQSEMGKSLLFRATQYGGSCYVGATYTFPHVETVVVKKHVIRDHFKKNFRVTSLREPHVISIAAVTGMTQFVMINVYTVSSYALKQAQASPKDIMVFLWVAGSTDLVSRLCCCFFADKDWMSIPFLYWSGQLLFLVTALVMTFLRESWTIVLICAAGFGFGLGIMYVLDLLLMMDILGQKKFQSVFGVSMVFRSCCSLVIGPIGGVIREVTGSYTPTYLFYCSILAMALIIPFLSGTYRTDKPLDPPKLSSEGV